MPYGSVVLPILFFCGMFWLIYSAFRALRGTEIEGLGNLDPSRGVGRETVSRRPPTSPRTVRRQKPAIAP